MIVEPVTLRPDDSVAEALELMERYRISGVPIVDDAEILVGILTNRDLRFETDVSQPVSALMTSRNLVTAPVGTTLARGRGDPPPQQDREAPGRRCRRQAQGPHHGQGHLEEGQVPGRDQGRPGPAASRSGRGGRHGRARARGRPRGRRGRRARRGHGARPLARRARRRARDSRQARGRARRRQHLDRRGRARARRRGGGCSEGRTGTWLLRRRHADPHGGRDVQEHRGRPGRRSGGQHDRGAGDGAGRMVHRRSRSDRRTPCGVARRDARHA